MKRALGALISPADSRDYQFRDLTAGAASKIPDMCVNISDEPIRDQGMSSMCGGFAGAAYRYSQEYFQSNNRDLISTTAIYGSDTELSQEGMYGRTLAKILVSGVCKVADWEIIADKATCKRVFNEHKNDPTVSQQRKNYCTSNYYFCDTWQNVLLAIASTKGCILMVPVYDNWYNCPPTGILGPNTGKLNGYHFVFAKDYVKNANGSYRIRIKNSWGDFWGDHGYGYLDTNVNTFTEAFSIVDNIDEVREMLFKDVDKDKWYAEVIDKVSNAGIMQGDGDGTFRPEDPITRAEAAAIVCKLKGL